MAIASAKPFTIFAAGKKGIFPHDFDVRAAVAAFDVGPAQTPKSSLPMLADFNSELLGVCSDKAGTSVTSANQGAILFKTVLATKLRNKVQTLSKAYSVLRHLNEPFLAKVLSDVTEALSSSSPAPGTEEPMTEESATEDARPVAATFMKPEPEQPMPEATANELHPCSLKKSRLEAGDESLDAPCVVPLPNDTKPCNPLSQLVELLARTEAMMAKYEERVSVIESLQKRVDGLPKGPDSMQLASELRNLKLKMDDARNEHEAEMMTGIRELQRMVGLSYGITDRGVASRLATLTEKIGFVPRVRPDPRTVKRSRSMHKTPKKNNTK